jgi:hypothetical protein
MKNYPMLLPLKKTNAISTIFTRNVSPYIAASFNNASMKAPLAGVNYLT